MLTLNKMQLSNLLKTTVIPPFEYPDYLGSQDKEEFLDGEAEALQLNMQVNLEEEKAANELSDPEAIIVQLKAVFARRATMGQTLLALFQEKERIKQEQTDQELKSEPNSTVLGSPVANRTRRRESVDAGRTSVSAASKAPPAGVTLTRTNWEQVSTWYPPDVRNWTDRGYIIDDGLLYTADRLHFISQKGERRAANAGGRILKEAKAYRTQKPNETHASKSTTTSVASPPGQWKTSDRKRSEANFVRQTLEASKKINRDKLRTIQKAELALLSPPPKPVMASPNPPPSLEDRLSSTQRYEKVDDSFSNVPAGYSNARAKMETLRKAGHRLLIRKRDGQIFVDTSSFLKMDGSLEVIQSPLLALDLGSYYKLTDPIRPSPARKLSRPTPTKNLTDIDGPQNDNPSRGLPTQRGTGNSHQNDYALSHLHRKRPLIDAYDYDDCNHHVSDGFSFGQHLTKYARHN